jgi:hypothetical protein
MATDTEKDKARLEARNQSADCPECGGEGLTTRWKMDENGREWSHGAYCHLCPMGRWVEERHRLDSPAVWRRIPDLVSFPAEQDPIRKERPSWRGARTAINADLQNYDSTPAALLRRYTAAIRARMAAEKHAPRPRGGAIEQIRDHAATIAAIVAEGAIPPDRVPDAAWRKADDARQRHEAARAADRPHVVPFPANPGYDDGYPPEYPF